MAVNAQPLINWLPQEWQRPGPVAGPSTAVRDKYATAPPFDWSGIKLSPLAAGAEAQTSNLPFDESRLQSGPDNFNSLLEAAMARRNAALETTQKQLGEPSYADVFAAPGADTLTRSYRTQQRNIGAELGRRGLQNSGAAVAAGRGLDEGYSRGLLDTEAAAAEAERQRRLGLTNQMLQINSADQSMLESILSGARPWVEATQEQATNEDDSLQGNIGFGLGWAQIIAATAAAGYGGAQGGWPGAASGAANASSFFNRGGGGGSYNFGDSGTGSQSPFEAPASTQSYSLGGMGGVNSRGVPTGAGGDPYALRRGDFAPAFDFGYAGG